jgi:hypothetical protein
MRIIHNMVNKNLTKIDFHSALVDVLFFRLRIYVHVSCHATKSSNIFLYN